MDAEFLYRIVGEEGCTKNFEFENFLKLLVEIFFLIQKYFRPYENV